MHMKRTILNNFALRFVAMFGVLVAGLSLVSCSSDDEGGQGGGAIVGTWRIIPNDNTYFFEVYNTDGTYYVTYDVTREVAHIEDGKYRFAGNTLTCSPNKGRNAGKTLVFTCKFEGRKLTMTPQGESGVKQFERHNFTVHH